MSKLLVLDIETSPWLAYGFGPLHSANHGLEQLTGNSHIIAFGAKWLGEPEMFYADVWKGRGRKRMLALAHKLMSEADALISFNGDRFDLPKLRGEFLEHGLNPLQKAMSIDVRNTTSGMGFTSGKLAHVAPLLECGSKVDTGGFVLWKDYMDGKEKARASMKNYNLKDVIVLEAVYLKVRSNIRGLPNYLGLANVCPGCGSSDIFLEKKRYTRVSEIAQFRCRQCAQCFEGSTRRLVQTISREEKRCPACKQTKPIEDFSKNCSRADGKRSECRPCGAVRARAYLDTPRGRENHRARDRRYTATPAGKAKKKAHGSTPERRAQNNAQQRARRASDPSFRAKDLYKQHLCRIAAKRSKI